MNVRERSARDLLIALGYENADRYSLGVVVRRLTNVETDVSSDRLVGVKDPNLSRILKAILSATKRKEEIVLIDVQEFGGPAVEKVVTRPDKEFWEDKTQIIKDFGDLANELDEKPKVKKKVKSRQPDEERLAVNRAAVVAVKGRQPRDPNEFDGYAKTAKQPHAKGTVMRTIFEILKGANKDERLSKHDVWTLLKDQFPLRDPERLYATVQAFPSWLPRHYPVSVHQTDKSYWLEMEGA